MKTLQQTARRKPGRPLGFDREAALHQAMLLFWQHGYEATSVNDLTKAMGITPPSLYTAFGDKKQLFLDAVHRYVSGPVTSKSIIEEAPTARAAAAGLLHAATIGFTDEATPAGCLLASSAISCSPVAADVQKALSRIRIRIEKRLRDKILQDQRVGKLTPKIDADALAGHIMAVIQGMSTLARDGSNREKLSSVAAVAMLAWPTSN
ncbi:TetR/AcrR family transcriptional regulator [Tunturiibacter empetritectus]|uniref:AcrR family transcriptional regulator n=2 Tax=Tunturiibacter TaxID=3154218 RepID=A0A852V948_9BACT|nr:TetR/AcrR family transcriptional regulator [Edaphobacter lichenicola]NYF88220.1 AcrR family transcriptional regulator [Edaphobacter lichenicola]